MGKGQDNERDLCKLFSLWWSEGLNIHPKRDDIFWRTAGSGARARVRTDAGKDVHQGYGDMIAEDPIGSHLIENCTFEFKRGYTALSLLDCIASKQKRPLLIEFLQGVEKDADDAGNEPILIFQKKYKKPVICFTMRLYLGLQDYCGKESGLISGAFIFKHCSLENKYMIMTLPEFLEWASPGYFLKERHVK